MRAIDQNQPWFQADSTVQTRMWMGRLCMHLARHPLVLDQLTTGGCGIISRQAGPCFYSFVYIINLDTAQPLLPGCPCTLVEPHSPHPAFVPPPNPQIWDLESKSVVDDLRPEFSKTFGKKATIPYCVSLAWSADGSTLYAGYTDGEIRVFVVSHGL